MTTTEFDNDTQTGAGKSGRVAAVRDKASEKIGAVKNRAGEAYGSARERTSAAYGTARERASSAAVTARQTASRARERTSSGVETSPIGALVGGLALGALVAAILPKSRKEEELLGSYGKRIGDTAREAARAAKEAGRGKLDELGLNQETAKEKLGDLASKAGEAARTSATAAAQTVKGGQQQGQQQP
ncbi:MAG TPA: hypothetical protein VGD19_08115 [Allosphingosinicella sp.]|jgi:hypothetical protein